jgi:hypothetical protein
MSSRIDDTVWEHSVPLDRSLWADNNLYMMTIPPRINKYNERGDDAAIQLQIDMAGKNNVGIVDGGLTTVGNINSLVFPEGLPDRMAALSYVMETVFFWDGKASWFKLHQVKFHFILLIQYL